MADDAVRDEAERLVAAAIAAVSMAARSIPGNGARAFATGSEECCVCPVCRLIAAMRDPDPDLVDRLASGAGDLAAAVAGVLRNVSGSTGTGAGPQAPPHAGPEPDAWQAATTAPPEPPAPAQPAPAQPTSPKKVAKKAIAKKAAAKRAAPAARPEEE